MPTPRPRKRTNAPRRRASDIQPEDAAFDVSEESMLPGGVSVEDPVGSPHMDEEPGAIAPPILAAGDDDADDGEDLHALWGEREATHARKRLQLQVVVGATMAAIIGIWALSLGDSLGTGLAIAGTQDSETFFDKLRSYEERLREYAPGGTDGPEAEATPSAFVESLKTKVTEAATSTEPVGGRR